jgi:ArsR family transcriptional regulator, arsenate/arsenite/antimonite-responsive transcriptional repressor
LRSSKIKIEKRTSKSKEEGATSVSELSASEAARVSKALGDPTRLGIYSYIAKHKELFFGGVSDCCMLSGATISHHLRVLSQAGLISARRSGQHVFYRALPSRLADYRRYLAKVGRPLAHAASKRRGRAAGS